MRAERLADADRGAASGITLSRPAGYLGVPRDRITLDGLTPPPGIPAGVPGVSTVKVKLTSGVGRAVASWRRRRFTDVETAHCLASAMAFPN